MPERDPVFRPQFRDDLIAIIRTNPRLAIRLLQMVDAICRDPFGGIGKPEPLRGNLTGSWSRRITDEHRLVYNVGAVEIVFIQARLHY